jgi:ubiquinone/menaquinone biosynthesis C-methylase UbiE
LSKKSEFVELKKGDALNLPIEDESIDIAVKIAYLISLKQKI